MKLLSKMAQFEERSAMRCPRFHTVAAHDARAIGRPGVGSVFEASSFASKKAEVYFSSHRAMTFFHDVFSRLSTPNKALEPTPTAVTPPAVAGVAPAAVVAHL
jgi:hypothetical protein